MSILDRVFAKHHYDNVADAITGENMKDPVARYIMSIVSSFAHYFTFHDQVPTHINERQGFADLTWPFITGAMTMAGVETQYPEVLIVGALERKNLEKDDLTEAKQAGQYPDGVTFWENSQIFLSEASTIHSPKAEKLRQDEKLKLGLNATEVLRRKILPNSKMAKSMRQKTRPAAVLGQPLISDFLVPRDSA
ncbi:hypothetical protein BGZ99_003147 [Dissophora globulifera]|uniref:Uncharacterized protein n=1 Tax=Dissophora globulifera TaxID=979702 RepID=A0A9P6UWH2_9FUNG|nr:hypothetical protein BGZ99_003147 [Dissophora globulifera]